MPGGVGIVAGDTADARIGSAEALAVSQSVGLEARYSTGRRPPSTLLFESTDTKLGDESELSRDLEDCVARSSRTRAGSSRHSPARQITNRLRHTKRFLTTATLVTVPALVLAEVDYFLRGS
jgi:hypothetical protein